MRVHRKPSEDRQEERKERIDALLHVRGAPLWLKLAALFLGALFVYAFIRWSIWAMVTVVIPRMGL